MNPVRRRRRKLAGAALAAHQRKVGRRSRRSSSRRIRRNPPQRTTTSRRRTHSAAMRAKISRAVKAANRRRSSRPFARTRAVIRRVGIRRSGAVSRRRGIRRAFRSAGSNLSLKTLLSRNVLMTASGAISASFLTSWLLRTYGARLPMANTMWGRIGYKLAIPFAGAWAAKKFAKQHDLAHGMIIGGVVMAVNDLIASFNQPRVAAGAAPVAQVQGPADYASQMIDGLNEGEYSEYFDEDPDGMGEYFDAAVDPLYSNTPAFDSAFA